MAGAEEGAVPAESAGERLDAYLARDMGSRAAAQRAIAEGRVEVDGVPRPKSWRVSGGEIVELRAQAATPADPSHETAPIVPIWSDERFGVVDKPAGMVSHPAPGHPSGTLVDAVAAARGGGPVGLVHRLDADTSGLLVVAWDEDALRILRDSLQRREITREYTALVMGAPATSQGTIEAPIGRDRRQRTKVSTRTDTPREAVTHFDVIEALTSATLLRVRLETGRTHQIRVHLSEAGLPVAGDPEYGRVGAFGLGRQFLHASRLEVPHPISGERLEFQSALPADLLAALESARSGVS